MTNRTSAVTSPSTKQKMILLKILLDAYNAKLKNNEDGRTDIITLATNTTLNAKINLVKIKIT